MAAKQSGWVNPKVEHYIRLLLNAANPGSLDYKAARFVLTDLVAKLKYKEKLIDATMAPEYVDRALAQLKQAGNSQPTAVDIDTSLNRARAAVLSKREERYRVVIPLDLQDSWIQRKRCFTVLGTEIERTTWQQVRTYSGWRQMESELNSWCLDKYDSEPFSFLSRFTPLRLDLRGRIIEEVFAQAEQAFEVLRSMLNLAALHNIIWQDQGGLPRPLGYCLPAPFYFLFKDNGDFVISLYSNCIYEYISKQEMRPELTKWFERNLKQMNCTKGWSERFLTDLLRMYGQALDARERSSAFLALWQVLETATTPEPGKVDYDRVYERVLCLLPHTGPLLEDALQCLGGSRHALVHEGRFSKESLIVWDSQDLQLVNILRYIAQHCIETLLQLAPKYGSCSLLEAYYDYRAASMRLDKLKEVIPAAAK